MRRAAVVGLALLAACSRPARDDWYVEELRQNRAKWDAHRPQCYRLTEEISTAFSGPTLDLTVDGDAIKGFNVVESVWPQVDASQAITVERAFAMIEEAFRGAPDTSARVTYDSRLGYPVEASIANKFMYDAWWDLRISHFEEIECAEKATREESPPPAPSKAMW